MSSHAARVDSSPRLRALLSALLQAGDRGLTALDVFQQTGSLNAHSCVHELRENGYEIRCDPQIVGGRRVYRYQLGPLRRSSTHEG